MDLKVIYKNARCAVLEIEDGGTVPSGSMNSRMPRETDVPPLSEREIYPGNGKCCYKHL